MGNTMTAAGNVTPRTTNTLEAIRLEIIRHVQNSTAMKRKMGENFARGSRESAFCIINLVFKVVIKYTDRRNHSPNRVQKYYFFFN